MSELITGSETGVIPNNVLRIPTQAEYSDTLQFYPHIDEAILREVSELRGLGYDINIVRPKARFDTDSQLQSRVDTAIGELSEEDDCIDLLFERTEHPTGANWLELRKRAIALHTLYNIGNIQTLGEGIDALAFDQPLFDNKSARQILTSENPSKAESIISKYERFLSTPMEDGKDKYGLTSRDYLANVMDSHAVRTRADAATERIGSHITSNADVFAGRSLTSASLACGAAGPVFEMVKQLEGQGIAFNDIKLVDWDVMALASAASLAKTYGVENKVDIQRRNLMTENLTDYIKPQSVDVVDMLGLFEYLPEVFKKAGIKVRAAESMLASARDIVRPGGIIVLGNMLDNRPQQKFFNKVWPKLFQRNITQVLKIIEGAGYDLKDVTVDIPGDEGVYAIYSIRIPEISNEVPVRRTLSERAAKWLMKKMSEY